jgi:predicted membrane channel-forming protein YqfA (hemolysin III family)
MKSAVLHHQKSEPFGKKINRRMLRKIASFILLVGGTSLVLYVLSIASNSPQPDLLVWGGLIFLFGLFFYWISPRKSSAPSERFRGWRKLRDQSGQKNKKK